MDDSVGVGVALVHDAHNANVVLAAIGIDLGIGSVVNSPRSGVRAHGEPEAAVALGGPHANGVAEKNKRAGQWLDSVLLS